MTDIEEKEGRGTEARLHLPVMPTVDMGPTRCPSWSPYKFILYFRPGSRSLTVASLSWPPTRTTWGRPSLSLYWTVKESKWPRGTVQERLRESGEDPVTVSSPRSGSSGGSGASVLGSVGVGVSSSAAEKGTERVRQGPSRCPWGLRRREKPWLPRGPEVSAETPSSEPGDPAQLTDNKRAQAPGVD